MSGVEVRRGRGASTPRRARGERGTVTAEAAAVVAVLVAVTLGLVWCLTLVVAQVRVVDGAREVARLAARGEADAVAVAAGARVAPDGAGITLHRRDGLVVVEVRVRVSGPGGIFAHVPGPTLHTRATAAQEPV